MHVSSKPYFSQSSNDNMFLQFQHFSVTWFSFGVSLPYAPFDPPEPDDVAPYVDPLPLVVPLVDPPVEYVDPFEPLL